MQINPDEITSILKDRIEGLDTSSADLTEVGTVLSVADGICTNPRARELHVVRDARTAARRHRAGAEPRVRQRWCRAVRRVGEDRRGGHRQADEAPARDPGRRRAARTDRRPARQPARRQGRDQHHRDAAVRVQGARRGPAPAGEGAHADRAQGRRFDDPDRPWAARAHHRRPPDRQDGDRGRRHHQQPGPRSIVYLRRHRAAQVDRRRRSPRRSRMPGRSRTRSS